MQDKQVFDIAIIGGGIAGAGIAREATLRELKVVLFEKNTFGSGTSGKSSKLIHGGLRYLEVAWNFLLRGKLREFWKNFQFVFLALKETHILSRTWPELITDIELLMPIYKHQGRSPIAIFLGTWLYGFFSVLSGGKHGTRILDSADAVLKLEPGLSSDGLLGGVIIWDHTTDDLALVRRILEDAKLHGAITFENTSVIHYQFEKTKKQFIIKTSGTHGEQTFYARKLINASGAWVDQVRQMATEKESSLIVPIAGDHVEVPIFSNYSIIFQAKDKRLFFAINRGDRARIGTTERLLKNPDHITPAPDEIQYLLRNVKRFFPQAPLDEKNILATDAGIRPLAKASSNVSLSEISREHQFVHDPDGAIHVLGVKLTDHRRAAVELLNKIR